MSLPKLFEFIKLVQDNDIYYDYKGNLNKKEIAKKYAKEIINTRKLKEYFNSFVKPELSQSLGISTTEFCCGIGKPAKCVWIKLKKREILLTIIFSFKTKIPYISVQIPREKIKNYGNNLKLLKKYTKNMKTNWEPNHQGRAYDYEKKCDLASKKLENAHQIKKYISIFKLIDKKNNFGTHINIKNDCFEIYVDHTSEYTAEWDLNNESLTFASPNSEIEEWEKFQKYCTKDEINKKVILYGNYNGLEYKKHGEMSVDETPYTYDGKSWLFTLKLSNKNKVPSKNNIELAKNIYNNKLMSKKKIINLISKTQEECATQGTTRTLKIQTTFKRDANIKKCALRMANSICFECKKYGPYKINKNEIYFLEIAHIEAIALGGKDHMENVIALCPNCHSKLDNYKMDKNWTKKTKLRYHKEARKRWENYSS